MHWTERHGWLYFAGIAALVILLGWVIRSASAYNHWESEPNCVALFRFEGTDDFHRNSVDPNHLTNSGGERLTATAPEGTSYIDFDAGETATATDANMPDAMWTGGPFTICFWFRCGSLYSSTTHWLVRKYDTDQHCIRIGAKSNGTDVLTVELGKDTGSTWDTYDHASDLGTGTWYWAGISVSDSTVFITLHTTSGQLGADINTSLLNPLNDEASGWTLCGVGNDMRLDELVFLDKALSESDLDKVRAGTFHTGEGPYTWTCDPVNGAWYRLGNTSAPWPRLADLPDAGLIARVASGDTIQLYEGDYHGRLDLSGLTNAVRQKTDWVTITQAAGHQDANLMGADLTASTYWKFKGNSDANVLRISPELGDPNGITFHNPATSVPMIFKGTNGSGQHHWWFEDCNIYSVNDHVFEDVFDTNDRTTRTWHGVYMYGNDLTVQDCTIHNVVIALASMSTNSMIDNCHIYNIMSDGIYTSSISNGGISDCNIHDSWANQWSPYWPSENDAWHVDMIQFSADASISDAYVRRNHIVSCVDVSRSTKKWSQGLFLVSDLENVVIENNVCLAQSTSNQFSISYGGTYNNDLRGVQIINNTLLATKDFGDPAYIRDLGGTGDREDITIINNVTASWPTGTGYTAANNIDSDTLTLDGEFVDYATGDMRLQSDSNLVDQGTTDYNEPADDLEGFIRDASPDVGAHEYQGSTPAIYLMDPAWVRLEDYSIWSE